MTFDTDAGDDLRSEINVTPLVDVMLVLLVIFMVVTPLLHRHEQVPIELPVARASEEPRTHDHVTLTATADETLLLDGEPVERSALPDALARIYAGGRERTIFLAADRTLKYDFVVALMDACRAAGIERIGIVTRQVHEEAQADGRGGAPAGRTSATPAG